jgi:hypothetical protein
MALVVVEYLPQTGQSIVRLTMGSAGLELWVAPCCRAHVQQRGKGTWQRLCQGGARRQAASRESWGNLCGSEAREPLEQQGRVDCSLMLIMAGASAAQLPGTKSAANRSPSAAAQARAASSSPTAADVACSTACHICSQNTLIVQGGHPKLQHKVGSARAGPTCTPLVSVAVKVNLARAERHLRKLKVVEGLVVDPGTDAHEEAALYHLPSAST